MAVAFLRGVVDALRLYAGPPGAWLGIFSAYQVERRPRGASRRKAAPTFVSGQLLVRDWRAATILTPNNPLPRSPTSAHYSAHPRLLKDRRT